MMQSLLLLIVLRGFVGHRVDDRFDEELLEGRVGDGGGRFVVGGRGRKVMAIVGRGGDDSRNELRERILRMMGMLLLLML